jgi:hypothetical protein
MNAYFIVSFFIGCFLHQMIAVTIVHLFTEISKPQYLRFLRRIRFVGLGQRHLVTFKGLDRQQIISLIL